MRPIQQRISRRPVLTDLAQRLVFARLGVPPVGVVTGPAGKTVAFGRGQARLVVLAGRRLQAVAEAAARPPPVSVRSLRRAGDPAQLLRLAVAVQVTLNPTVSYSTASDHQFPESWAVQRVYRHINLLVELLANWLPSLRLLITRSLQPMGYNKMQVHNEADSKILHYSQVKLKTNELRRNIYRKLCSFCNFLEQDWFNQIRCGSDKDGELLSYRNYFFHYQKAIEARRYNRNGQDLSVYPVCLGRPSSWRRWRGACPSRAGRARGCPSAASPRWRSTGPSWPGPAWDAASPPSSWWAPTAARSAESCWTAAWSTTTAPTGRAASATRSRPVGSSPATTAQEFSSVSVVQSTLLTAIRYLTVKKTLIIIFWIILLSSNECIVWE